MRRLSLFSRLAAAMIPLLLVAVGLLGILTRSSLTEIEQTRSTSDTASAWISLSAAMQALQYERSATFAGDQDDLDASRRLTASRAIDAASDLAKVGDGRAADRINTMLSTLMIAREQVDAAGGAVPQSAVAGFDSAGEILVSAGWLIATESAGSPLSRDLTMTAVLSEISHLSLALSTWLSADPDVSLDLVSIGRTQRTLDQLDDRVALFASLADQSEIDALTATGIPGLSAELRQELDGLIAGVSLFGDIDPGITAAFISSTAQVAEMRDQVAINVVSAADDESLRQTVIIIAIASIAATATLLALWMSMRSLRRLRSRLREMSTSLDQISTATLPALVDALNDPSGSRPLPTLPPLSVSGNDEFAQVAHSLNQAQESLSQVAVAQRELLKRGVSDLFVTLALRSRGLVERQLALLDELEQNVTDPALLTNYFKLDHLAARLRRTSDGLIVLSGVERSVHRSAGPADIAESIQAAISEVNDFSRVKIESLEPIQILGPYVSDLTHLLAELIENATQFSAPSTTVRVYGAWVSNEYTVTIVDQGIGMDYEKMAAMNRLLADPPVVGLSMETTLGISVVAIIAHRNGMSVTLQQHQEGGTSAVITLPGAMLEEIVTPEPIGLVDDTWMQPATTPTEQSPTIQPTPLPQRSPVTPVAPSAPPPPPPTAPQPSTLPPTPPVTPPVQPPPLPTTQPVVQQPSVTQPNALAHSRIRLPNDLADRMAAALSPADEYPASLREQAPVPGTAPLAPATPPSPTPVPPAVPSAVEAPQITALVSVPAQAETTPGGLPVRQRSAPSSEPLPVMSPPSAPPKMGQLSDTVAALLAARSKISDAEETT
jgi:methyl-accepting chemotaxis protein